MMCCGRDCPLETVKQHSGSPGVISDDERVSRGAYGPTLHYRKGRITNALIRNNDLVAGRLSVWRLGPGAGLDIEALTQILSRLAPAGQYLKSIKAVSVQRIRQITASNQTRSACVLDECQTDDRGGEHPAHAHISPCRHAPQLTVDDPNFQRLKSCLLDLFTEPASEIWASPTS
jgi:hypothetical protein